MMFGARRVGSHQSTARRIRTPVDGLDYVSVITAAHSPDVTLLTRFSGDVNLKPMEALRLARALIAAALLVGLRP